MDAAIWANEPTCSNPVLDRVIRFGFQKMLQGREPNWLTCIGLQCASATKMVARDGSAARKSFVGRYILTSDSKPTEVIFSICFRPCPDFAAKSCGKKISQG